jgi:hypothetical protein
VTTAELTMALAERYSGDAWAFLPQVRSSVGYAERTVRTADALAMGLWPSRGLELHGFEIKCERADWIKELNNPAKADKICRFCDRWWLVANEGIVQPGELPATWGLLCPRGNKLVCKTEPNKCEAEPMTRLFLAAMIRGVKAYVAPKLDGFEKWKDAQFQSGREQGARERGYEVNEAKRSLERERKDNDALRESIREFQNKSGVRIDAWSAGDVGDAVRIITNAPKAKELMELSSEMLERYRNVVQRLESLTSLQNLPVCNGCAAVDQ